MKYVFEYIGHHEQRDQVLMLIRSSGTTGNIIKDHESVFTFSSFIENGEVTEFKCEGPNKVFTIHHRMGFKIQAMQSGFVDVEIDFLEERWPSLSSTLLKDAEESLVFQRIKYGGD